MAQSWAWAVYHDGHGSIMVANMADVAATSNWRPLPPYTHQGLRQAQQAACLLVLEGDLATRRYKAPQIERGEWWC